MIYLFLKGVKKFKFEEGRFKHSSYFLIKHYCRVSKNTVQGCVLENRGVCLPLFRFKNLNTAFLWIKKKQLKRMKIIDTNGNNRVVFSSFDERWLNHGFHIFLFMGEIDVLCDGII